jgi:hypothetical protein
MFKLYAAQFQTARTEIQLQPVSLAGGIANLQIIAPAITPSGTELIFEVNIGGRWYPLKDAVNISSTPDILPIRAVLLGTTDLQPALILQDQAITASRPANTFFATSTTRTLSASRQNIEVQVLVHKFDQTKHTLSCQLINTSNNTTLNPAVTSSAAEDTDTIRFTFTFTSSSGIQNYKIKISGSKTADAMPYTVIERIDIAY